MDVYTICRQKDLNKLNLLIKSEIKINWNDVLSTFCYEGNLEIINLVISKIEQTLFNIHIWNEGFKGACEGGQLKIVKLMISKGADDWGEGLFYSCYKKHLKIINLICLKIKQTESRINNWNRVNNWNKGLYGASLGGHLKLCNLMISRIELARSDKDEGLPQDADDWGEGLYYACQGGYLEIVNLMISRIEQTEEYLLDKHNNWNWNRGLEGACFGGHLDIINLMILKGADDWNDGFRGACHGGHLEIVNLMISRIELAQSEDEDISQEVDDWNDGIEGACACIILDSLEIKLEHLEKRRFCSVQECLEIINLMILKGATNIEHISKEIGIKLLYINKNDKLKVIKGIPKYLDLIYFERKVFKEHISFIIKDLNNLILNFLYL